MSDPLITIWLCKRAFDMPAVLKSVWLRFREKHETTALLLILIPLLVLANIAIVYAIVRGHADFHR